MSSSYTAALVAAAIITVNTTYSTQALKDEANNAGLAAWNLLRYFELGAGIISLALGTVSYFFGGIIAYVTAGLNVGMLGTVVYLMYSFTQQFNRLFFVLWVFAYEYYCDYAAVVFALIGGIASATAAAPQVAALL